MVVLILCSGHVGTAAAEYTARALPGRICAALHDIIPLRDGLDPQNDQSYQESISALLRDEIEKFDKEIGEAVIALCKKPKKLSEAEARDLVEKHSEVLSRAYHGTTLTLALVNRAQEAMWLAGVGDSTVGEWDWIGLPGFDSQLPMHFKHCQHFHALILTVCEAESDYWTYTLRPRRVNISEYQ